MAAQKVVVEGSIGVSASQLKDLFRQIEDGSITGPRLQAFLEKRDQRSLFSVWKTVTVGERSKEDLLAEKAMKRTTLATSVLGGPSFAVVGIRKTIALGCAHVSDLGFTTAASVNEVWRRITELGQRLCPVEVGPLLSLRLADNPPENSILIASGRLGLGNGQLAAFSINTDGWLEVVNVSDAGFLLLDQLIVFEKVGSA